MKDVLIFYLLDYNINKSLDCVLKMITVIFLGMQRMKNENPHENNVKKCPFALESELNPKASLKQINLVDEENSTNLSNISAGKKDDQNFFPICRPVSAIKGNIQSKPFLDASECKFIFILT